MSSIGNDIVALNATDPIRTVTPRFYQKFLTAAELDLYHQFAPLLIPTGTLPLHQYIWLAWSAKEAAYKCLQRHQPDLIFSPIKILLTAIEANINAAHPQYHLQLTFNNQTLTAEANIFDDEVIHTIVCHHAGTTIQSAIHPIHSANPQAQSEGVRIHLLKRLKTLHPEAQITIDKDSAGIPYITINDTTIPVSLSHHDKWVGYAF